MRTALTVRPPPNNPDPDPHWLLGLAFLPQTSGCDHPAVVILTQPSYCDDPGDLNPAILLILMRRSGWCDPAAMILLATLLLRRSYRSPGNPDMTQH